MVKWISVSFPSYVKVFLSGWLFRAVHIACKLVTIPLLLHILSGEEYVALVIVASLEGWFLLFDFGVGSSLQNYLSESRAKGENDKAFLKTGFVLALLTFCIGALFLYTTLSLSSQFFLGKLLPTEEAKNLFLLSGLFLLFGTFGSVASKILLSRGKGHVVYLLQGVGSLLSLAFLISLQKGISLQGACFASIGIPSLISLMVAFFVFSKVDWKQPLQFSILLRAKSFFIFSFMAAWVTLSDTLVAPRVLQVEEMIEYNFLCKVFGVASFAYGSVIQGLFPVCSEEQSLGAFSSVLRRIKKGGTLCSLGVVLFSICFFLSSNVVERIFTIRVHFLPVVFFMLYLCIC